MTFDEDDVGWPPRFTLDTGHILELLTGDRFYSNKDAALREAVLNAVDACHRRRASGVMVDPAISVVFDDEAHTVVIADNGDGMGADEISRLFARVGASMSRMATDVDVVGEFGIGVVSYFLVADSFEVRSLKVGSPPVALRFSRSMLDAKRPAELFDDPRSEIGTTLTIYVRDSSTYEMLVDRYSHWCRDVRGLDAVRSPGGVPVPQGATTSPGAEIAFSAPDWLETGRIGPPVSFDGWSLLDGRATVDILYRGVFVQQERVDGLWGLRGTLSVRPKQLKPQLNREGFLSDDLKGLVVPFLQAMHPAVLEAGLATLQAALESRPADEWAVGRLVGLWLAVPRDSAYAAVVQHWDAVFRSRQLFRHLETVGESPVSLQQIAQLPEPVYLAPDDLSRTTDVVRAAVRILRAKGASVVSGLVRDSGYLEAARFTASSTAELLISSFADELGAITKVEDVAESVMSSEARVAPLFHSQPMVSLVRLGEEGAPVALAAGELWINIDTDEGRSIVQHVCDENLGRASLLVACYEHAGQHVAQLGQFLRSAAGGADHLGLVARQHLRKVLR